MDKKIEIEQKSREKPRILAKQRFLDVPHRFFSLINNMNCKSNQPVEEQQCRARASPPWLAARPPAAAGSRRTASPTPSACCCRARRPLLCTDFTEKTGNMSVASNSNDHIRILTVLSRYNTRKQHQNLGFAKFPLSSRAKTNGKAGNSALSWALFPSLRCRRAASPI